ncbi:MAG: hypothetical protein WC344_05520, partial [Bacilli bacterium]
MSKKAEELWATLTQRYWERQDMSRDEGLALIDDFARKVLERAAQRVRKLAENTMDNIPLIDAIAAILA